MHTARLLEGRGAIVTGGATGIGRVIARSLAREGCHVAINYVGAADQADQAVGELRALGVEAIALAADVRRAGEVQSMIGAAVQTFGRLDVLVNNAAVQIEGAFLDVSEDDWDRVIDTNLKGTFLCTQAAARQMAKSGGAIVNIGSGSNFVPFPTLVAYTCSKGRSRSRRNKSASIASRPARFSSTARSTSSRTTRASLPRSRRWDALACRKTWLERSFFSPATLHASSPDRRSS
jgi:NADP-dependent 3-hydroxy acid dehydrogenase YdfG